MALCLGLALGSCKTPAEDPEDPPPLIGEEQDGPDAYDNFQTDLSERVVNAAGWLDSFLADERDLAEQDSSSMTVRLESFWEEREAATFKARVKARVALPRSKKRLQLVVSEFESEDEFGTFDVPEDPNDFDETSPDVGLQFRVKRTEHNNARLEGGVRLNGFEPNPYVGLRIRHTKVFDIWALRFRERIRNYLEEGFESRASLDFERLVGEDYFFRTTSYGNWFQENNAWFLGQSFTVFQVVDEWSLISYEWSNSFTSEPEYIWSETRLRIGWNRRFKKDVIALELAPQIAWREAIDYEPTIGIFLRLEFLFGAAAKR